MKQITTIFEEKTGSTSLWIEQGLDKEAATGYSILKNLG